MLGVGGVPGNRAPIPIALLSGIEVRYRLNDGCDYMVVGDPFIVAANFHVASPDES